MFISSWDARRRQQRLCSRPHLAVAARHTPLCNTAAIPNGWRCGFPSCTTTQWTNVCGALITGFFHLHSNSLLSTLHQPCSLAQVAKASILCTSCEGTAWPVDAFGKSFHTVRKSRLDSPNSITGVVKQASGAVLTVDIRPRQRTIRDGQVSQLSHSQFFPPGAGWDRKRPARRDS